MPGPNIPPQHFPPQPREVGPASTGPVPAFSTWGGACILPHRCFRFKRLPCHFIFPQRLGLPLLPLPPNLSSPCSRCGNIWQRQRPSFIPQTPGGSRSSVSQNTWMSWTAAAPRPGRSELSIWVLFLSSRGRNRCPLVGQIPSLPPTSYPHSRGGSGLRALAPTVELGASGSADGQQKGHYGSFDFPSLSLAIAQCPQFGVETGPFVARLPPMLYTPLPTATSYGVQEVNQMKRLIGPGLSKGPEPSISVMVTGGPWPNR